MSGAKTLPPPMLWVISCGYVDEPYIAKTRNVPLTSCEDGIILRSFVLTQYWRVADRQTNNNAIANTARSTAARCNKPNPDKPAPVNSLMPNFYGNYPFNFMFDFLSHSEYKQQFVVNNALSKYLTETQ